MLYLDAGDVEETTVRISSLTKGAAMHRILSDRLRPPRALGRLRLARRLPGPVRAVDLDVAHTLRTLQIVSIGQCRAHSVSASFRYVEVAPGGGWISIRSSTTNPFLRNTEIHSP